MKIPIGFRIVPIVVMAMMLLLSFVIPTSAVKIGETRTLLENSNAEVLGYLNVEAMTPLGFEGSLCVELLKEDTYQPVKIYLSAYQYFIGGQYLEPGEYSVDRLYALDDDSIIVTADCEKIVIDTDGDAFLHLMATTDPGAQAEWEAMMETYEPPVFPTNPTEEKNEPASETTEEIVLSQPDVKEYVQQQENAIGNTVLKLVLSLATTISVGGVLCFVIVKTKNN